MNSSLYRYYIIDRAHHANRIRCNDALGEQYRAMGLSDVERMTRRFEYLTSLEVPHIHPEEQIALVRTVANLPDIYTEDEWAGIKEKHYVHELGYVSNLSPNYAKVIAQGLLDVRTGATEHQARMIDALISLCDRYRDEAARMGRTDLVDIFTRVPRYGAQNFREALQFFRILHYALWLEGDYHNTVGRFDRYMYPYFQKDMAAGLYTEETALALLEDFFLSFNKDSDLYVGVQQGDNGQSMVLGGCDADGNDCFNLLSVLCLKASRNLKLIDPKINVRVSKKTPLSIYELGTELTSAGLGFPQYSNDDVVIPGLEKLGYSHEDAANYVVAACWEFIIPGCGNDIANIDALNFPALTDRAIRKCIHGADFDALLQCVKEEISAECDRICAGVHDIYFVPSPLLDLMRDGKKYNNFGIHGCGIASAADALTAVKKHVYEQKSISPCRLIAALDTDFADDPELLHLLRYDSPKMGTGDPDTHAHCGMLLSAFANALHGKTNCQGGVWRAGTGTAMYYLWHARELGATADGRRAGEPLGTNFSPSLFARIPGPVTDIEAFTANDLSRTINGGPLTLEFTASIFQNSESIRKVATLIQYFIMRGGHQLQLNAVDLEAMRQAQKNPDAYRQLVVRIWGWSAYFVELDKEYQDHVMARQEYSV